MSRRARELLAQTLVVWLVVLAGELAPHLVHHAVGAEHEASDCEFLALADHAPAAVAPLTLPAVGVSPGEPVGLVPEPVHRAAPVPAGFPRAPPGLLRDRA